MDWYKWGNRMRNPPLVLNVSHNYWGFDLSLPQLLIQRSANYPLTDNHLPQRRTDRDDETESGGFEKRKTAELLKDEA
jgi:hypothetical protein